MSKKCCFRCGSKRTKKMEIGRESNAIDVLIVVIFSNLIV